MPMDGSETSNIERQSLGDLLPGRANPLKQHGSNVVDRSFRQTATPLGSIGTPENILGTLVEAAGHVGTAAGTYMQQKVDEDKTVQAMRFYEGMAPSDDATTAGYRTHAILGMSNKVLESTARLKDEAAYFTGTDAEWEQKVRDSQTADHNAIVAQHPGLERDPLANKAIVAMYGEQVPNIAAARVSAKLAQEHQGRLNTFRDHIRVRVDGLPTAEADKVLTGVMEDTDTLQLTKGEREKELAALAIEKSEAGDLSIIDFTKRYNGGQETSLFDRSNALQKAEIAGKKVYWANHQSDIAAARDTFKQDIISGKYTKDEAYKKAGELDAQFSGNFASVGEMGSLVGLMDKDPAMVHAGEDALVKSNLEEDLKLGKYNGNRAGFFQSGQGKNDSAKRPVVTAEWLLSAWDKHEKEVAQNTDLTHNALEFLSSDKSNRSPQGQRGWDTKTTEGTLDTVKKIIEKSDQAEIAKLPPGHSPEDEKAIHQRSRGRLHTAFVC